MKSTMLRWFAITLILEVGLIHIMTAQGEYEEAAYMGYLFAANFFGTLIAAYAIHRRQIWGWVLGWLIAAGSMAGYVWSRTRGMPGMQVEEWFSPYGIVSLSVESCLLFLALARPWKTIADDSASAVHPVRRAALPALSLLTVVVISGFTYQWNDAVIDESGHYVGILGFVRHTPDLICTPTIDGVVHGVDALDQIGHSPPLTADQLLAQYGVEVSLVANSMMGSIVDVRLRIVDPDKAHLLIQNQAGLLVNQHDLILAPTMHSHAHNRLRAGTQYIVFFPAGRIVHRGSSVSLMFGSVSTEPVVVQ